MSNRFRTIRRAKRTRFRLRNSNDRPRLSVHRSGLHIYAQIIDDLAGRTLVAAASTEKEVRDSLSTGANTKAAAHVGLLIAVRGKKAGIGQVKFDRGGLIYHGRVRALAEAARKGGLEF